MTTGTERTRSAKTLVVYYSLTGNTARVARDIAKRTGADLESIRDRDHGVGFFGLIKNCFDALREEVAWIAPLSRDPAEYDLTVIGTPVWVGRMTPALRAYLQQMRGRFGRVAFFVTSGNTDIARVRPALEAAAQTKATACAGFSVSELKDESVYEAKLESFLNDLQSRRLDLLRELTSEAHETDREQHTAERHHRQHRLPQHSQPRAP